MSLGFKYTAFVQPGWYMENFITSAEEAKAAAARGQKGDEMMFGGFPSVPDQDGVLTMKYPSIGDKEGGKYSVA